MPRESNASDRIAGNERAVLRVAVVVVVVAAITLIRTSFAFDSFFKGFIQGAAGVLALIAVCLVIPAARRRLFPADLTRWRTGTRGWAGTRGREAGYGLSAVTIGLVVALVAAARVPAMSGLAGGLLAVGSLVVLAVGIVGLLVVPGQEPTTTVDDDAMWLPSRDGDV